MPSYQEPIYSPRVSSPKLNPYHNQLHIYEYVNGTSFLEKYYLEINNITLNNWL